MIIIVIDTNSPPSNPVVSFEEFFRTFEDPPNEFKYRRKISEAYAKSENFIVVLFEDILNFDPQLAHYLTNTPERALDEAVEAFKNILRFDSGGQFNQENEYFIRITTLNNSNEVKLRKIRAKHIDKLIYVKGIVIRSSAVRPQIVNSVFECPLCGNLMEELQLAEKIKVPNECSNPSCNNKRDFKILTDESTFIDFQLITLQESPEELRSGTIPQTQQAILLHDLVDSIRPGERVKVMGILKSLPKEDGRGKLSTVFNTRLIVNNIEGLQQQDEEVDITPQELEQIRELSQEEGVQKKIARSIARGILGHEHLKMAAALSLFGGNQKIKADGSKLRGDIHVLFMGDPGTGKSQILQNAAQIAGRSIYTSGKGASAAGLTAAVIRENDNSGMQLEAGALVLASGGVACTTGDSRFIKENGESMQFRELFVNCKEDNVLIKPDFKVMALNEETLKIEPFPIKQAFKKPSDKRIIRLLTQSGRSINLTEDNEIYLEKSNSFSWVPMSDVVIGDNIAVPKSSEASSVIITDKIIELMDIEKEFVYDFTMEGTNNFVCNNIIMHNCIDEFDKMKTADRSAIHEAMEQQSYHPQFEITFNTKQTTKIGPLVDSLFEKFPENKIEGKDCEILGTQNLGLRVKSTDFQNFMELPVHRVSRHSAPTYFIKIQYSNGREILVTPDHPIFYMGGDSSIKTIEAEKITPKTFIPALNSISYEGDLSLHTDVKEGRKQVLLPSTLTHDLAIFLGYYISEGYSYLGASAEVGLSNSDPIIIGKMMQNIETVFGTIPIDNTENNRTIRIISIAIYDYLHNNFPELMSESYEKKIPPQIFYLDTKGRAEFLRSAFEGDGGVESTSIAYSTVSRSLAYDYQDLLLTLGIHSRITSESYTFGQNNQESRIRYKVYIRGNSLLQFKEQVNPYVANGDQFEKILEKCNKTNRRHDVIPAGCANLILECMSRLGLTNDGYFYDHLKNNYGINREILKLYQTKIADRLHTLKTGYQQYNTLKELREFLQYSQNQCAEISEYSRRNIDYAEKGGYNEEKRSQILQSIKKGFEHNLLTVENNLRQLQDISKFRWLRINSIEKVENKGEYHTEWVYDVTIEPTESFISHGIVLHNTVSVAKAGIVATLQSKTAIIAAANPKAGRWDDYANAAENINLSPPILSRFDLIYVVRDIPETTNDDRIAGYILKNHMEGLEETYADEEEAAKQPKKEDFIPMDLLRKYIRHAKNEYHPRITRDAAKKIQDFYVSMRNINTQGSAVSIVARNLESLVRMSEAYAKMALRNIVKSEDVDAVLDLERKHLKDIGYDEETGSYDVDIIQTGQSSSKRSKLKKILDHIKSLQSEDPTPFTFEDVFEPLVSQGLNEDFVREALTQLSKEGDIYSPKPGTYKLAKKTK